MLIFIELLEPSCLNCLCTLTKFPRVAASAPLCTADIARLNVFGLSPPLFGSPSLVLLSLSLSSHCIWRPSSPCDALEATCFSSCLSFFPRHPEHHSGISRYLFAPVAHGSSCAGRVARKNKRRGRRRSEMFINKADLFAIPTHTYTHTHIQLHILIRKFISIDNEKSTKKHARCSLRFLFHFLFAFCFHFLLSVCF